MNVCSTVVVRIDCKVVKPLSCRIPAFFCFWRKVGLLVMLVSISLIHMHTSMELMNFANRLYCLMKFFLYLFSFYSFFLMFSRVKSINIWKGYEFAFDFLRKLKCLSSFVPRRFITLIIHIVMCLIVNETFIFVFE